MSSERCFLGSADEIMQFLHSNMIRQGFFLRRVQKGAHDGSYTQNSMV